MQSFRGKGRGRGFEVIPQGSGLSDEKLTRAVHEKVVAIVQTLESRGFPIARQAPTRETTEPASMKNRIGALERELERERATRGLLETEIRDLKGELERDQQLRLRTLAQVGKLSSQLDRAKATEERLLDASRQCVASLRQLRQQLKGMPFAAESLAPLVINVKGMVDLIQELRVVSSIRSTAATADFLAR